MIQSFPPDVQSPAFRNSPMPRRLLLYLGYQGLGGIFFLALAALTLMLLEILWSLPGVFAVLVTVQGLIWAVYLIPGFLAIAYTVQASPKALFPLKLSAWSALIISFLDGLAISAAGPDFMGDLAAFLRELYPESKWLPSGPEDLAVLLHLLIDALVAINAAWLLYLKDSEEVKNFFSEERDHLPPEFTSMPQTARPTFREMPGLLEGLMGVFFILLIFQGLSSATGTISVFLKYSGVSASSFRDLDFLRFIFVNFSFYLVLCLVPPVAAAFGLGSLKKEKERGRSALLIALLVIMLFALLSLASNLINLGRFYDDGVSKGYFAMIFLTPLFYVLGSTFFMATVLRRRNRGRRELADHNW